MLEVVLEQAARLWLSPFLLNLLHPWQLPFLLYHQQAVKYLHQYC